MTFLDTSAIYALADQGDPHHEQARGRFANLLPGGFLTHDYVLVESTALLQRRLGLEPALRFCRQAQQFRVVWVDAGLHREAVELLASLTSRLISLVDCMSFVVMRREGLDTALAFDIHFQQQGFHLA